MRYADVIWNDIVAGDGLCVSFIRKVALIVALDVIILKLGIFEGGKEFPASLLDEIVEKLNAQGIKRSLCILVESHFVRKIYF